MCLICVDSACVLIYMEFANVFCLICVDSAYALFDKGGVGICVWYMWSMQLFLV